MFVHKAGDMCRNTILEQHIWIQSCMWSMCQPYPILDKWFPFLHPRSYVLSSMSNFSSGTLLPSVGVYGLKLINRISKTRLLSMMRRELMQDLKLSVMRDALEMLSVRIDADVRNLFSFVCIRGWDYTTDYSSQPATYCSEKTCSGLISILYLTQNDIHLNVTTSTNQPKGVFVVSIHNTSRAHHEPQRCRNICDAETRTPAMLLETWERTRPVVLFHHYQPKSQLRLLSGMKPRSKARTNDQREARAKVNRQEAQEENRRQDQADIAQVAWVDRGGWHQSWICTVLVSTPSFA